MKKTVCLAWLLGLLLQASAQEKAEIRKMRYGEFAVVTPASVQRYSAVDLGFRLSGGKQLFPGLDIGAGLETNLFFWEHDYLSLIPFVQFRGSSHAHKKYGFYYSLSGGIGKMIHEKGPPPRRERPQMGTLGFVQLMAGARIYEHGLLSFGLRYYFEQYKPDSWVDQGLHFSGQLGIMLEGQGRQSTPHFDAAIHRLYFYAATGLWILRRSDLNRAFLDGSFSFGAGRNFFPYLGFGLSVTMMNGIDRSWLFNEFSLIGIGLHANGQWKNLFLTLEGGPVLKASEGYSTGAQYEIFSTSKNLKPYLKLSLGRKIGKNKRVFLFMSYIRTPQLDGVLRVYENYRDSSHRAKTTISRFQLGTGIFLSNQ